MTDLHSEWSPRATARIAGIGFLLTMCLPTLSALLVFFKLVVPENPAASAANILAHEMLFRIGIVSDLMVLANILVTSLALHALLKTFGRNLALLALICRIVEAALVGVAALAGLIALLLYQGKIYATIFEARQVQALAGLFLDARMATYTVAVLLSGMGSALFCYLFSKSKSVPGILAAFGILAYVMLVFLSVLTILFPDHATVAQIVLLPASCLFEPLMGMWLIIKGVMVRQTT